MVSICLLAPPLATLTPSAPTSRTDKDKFSPGVGVCTGRVKHADALSGCLVKGNVVHPGACPGNRNERGETFCINPGTSDNNAMRIIHIRSDNVSFVKK